MLDTQIFADGYDALESPVLTSFKSDWNPIADWASKFAWRFTAAAGTGAPLSRSIDP